LRATRPNGISAAANNSSVPSLQIDFWHVLFQYAIDIDKRSKSNDIHF
jgi:hypothetical protein